MGLLATSLTVDQHADQRGELEQGAEICARGALRVARTEARVEHPARQHALATVAQLAAEGLRADLLHADGLIEQRVPAVPNRLQQLMGIM